MRATSPHAPSLESPGRDWLVPTLGVALVLVAGVVLGIEYIYPEKRSIAVLAALVVVGIAWRIDMVSGICLLAVMLPFPRGMVFGSSNVAFILLLLVIWLLRVTLGQSPKPRRTPMDVPLVGLLIAYVVSFYNIERVEYLSHALHDTNIFISCVLMFYLIANNVRTERDLERFHAFQAVSVAAVTSLAVWELSNPGSPFIKGWIQFEGAEGSQIVESGMRVGGPFHDFELLSEFCALNLLLATFLFARARTTLRRTLFGGLLVLTTFVMFATVTRGGIISLAAGTAYLLWIVRRRLRLVPFVTLAAVAVAVFLLMNYYVANYTRSGDLLERLMGTQLHGLVPDTRVKAWSDGWERFLLQPIIGHGPYYAPMTGTRTWIWPHNGYLLIANFVGLFGFSFFLALLWKLFTASRPKVDSLRGASYAQSYLPIAHTQLIVFMIDQMKIEFLRNSVYTFQVWLLFATIVAGSMVARRSSLQRSGPSG